MRLDFKKLKKWAAVGLCLYGSIRFCVAHPQISSQASAPNDPPAATNRPNQATGSGSSPAIIRDPNLLDAELKEILATLEEARDFEENSLQLFRDHPPKNLLPAIRGITDAFKQNMSATEQDIENFQEGALQNRQMDLFLKEQLEIRLGYLVSRKSKIHDRNFVATSPGSLRARDENDGNLVIARTNIDRYQLRNRLILQALQTVDPTQLSDTIKKEIRVSRSLHSYLEGKTDDAGYPDQAITLSRNKHHPPTDHDLYLWHLHNAAIPFKNIGSNPNQKSINSGLTMWEAFKIGLITEKDLKPEFISSLQHAGGIDELALPELAWLDSPKTPPVASPAASREAASPTAEEVIAATGTDKDPITEVADTMDQARDFLTQVQTAERGNLRVCSDTKPDPIPERKADGKEEKKSVRSRRVPRPPILRALAPTPPTLSQDFVAPSGVRKFSKIDPNDFKNDDIQAKLAQLKSSDRKWLSHLLAKQLRTVKFSDFKRVWIQLNGDDSVPDPTSGAHRNLFNKNKLIVDKISAHNDAHLYFGGYQKYLVQAFRTIGVRDEDLN